VVDAFVEIFSEVPPLIYIPRSSYCWCSSRKSGCIASNSFVVRKAYGHCTPLPDSNPVLFRSSPSSLACSRAAGR